MRAGAVARRVQQLVGETGRADPGERRRQGRQQRRRAEGAIDDAGQEGEAGNRAEHRRDRRNDEYAEHRAGDRPAPDPQIFDPARQEPQARAAAEGFADQLIGEIGVQGDAVDWARMAEPGVERGREEIFYAFGSDADDDRPAARQPCRVIAAHDLADALFGERVGAAMIVEQHLVSATVEPDIGPARVVERRDQRLPEAQIAGGAGREPDPITGEIAQGQRHPYRRVVFYAVIGKQQTAPHDIARIGDDIGRGRCGRCRAMPPAARSPAGSDP